MQFTFEQARKYAGLTQDQMAERLNLSKSAYIALEKNMGRARVSQVLQIADAAGLSVEDIFLPCGLTLVSNGKGEGAE